MRRCTSRAALLVVALSGCSNGLLGGLDGKGPDTPKKPAVEKDLDTSQKPAVDKGPGDADTAGNLCGNVQTHTYDPKQQHPRIWLTPARLTLLRSQQMLASSVWKEVLVAATAQSGLIGAATGAMLYAVTGT